MKTALKSAPMAPDPKRQQREASDPARSVWVNASAGSGKTTILTRRVMRLLLEGTPPARILCLTFTRAAAAQMALLITQNLSEWATCGDNELSASIADLQNRPPTKEQTITARRLFARVLSCPGGMRIRTIHAFGQEVLRRFPIEAGLPPHFVVIEDNDARAMQEDVLMELLRELADPAPHLKELAAALSLLTGNLGEQSFRDALREILHDRAKLDAAIKNAGGLHQLRAETRALIGLASGETSAQILRTAVDFAVLPRVDVETAARQLAEASDSFAKKSPCILEWLALPPDARVAEFTTYCGCFLTKEEITREKLVNKDLLKKYPDLEMLLRREAERLETVCARLACARMAEVTDAVLALGAEFIRRYGARKALQAALDYDDLIIRTDKLLSKPGIAPWILYKLDGGLDHILVDEAQDTSRAQWNIVQRLSEEFFAGAGAHGDATRTLFVVGDEKQSIFSFQNADPAAFAAMQSYFAARTARDEEKLHPVGLHVSFRSAPAILQAVDAVFARDLARAGVSMEPVAHYAARPSGNEPPKIGRIEVWPLIPQPQKDKTDEDGAWPLPLGYEAENDPQAELAARIADKIADWQKHKETLPGAERPIAPGDIMILLRRRGRFADLMVRALKQRGIAVSGVDRMHLLKQLAVMDLLALMQFTLLPGDDLNLAAVLRGPLLNVSEEQLMQLAIGRAGTLWQSLIAQAAKDQTFAAAHDYLAHWLAAADFMTPFAMLARILNEACPGSSISGRRAIWARLGPDALDPVEELLNAAQSFGRTHAPSLQGFVHWLTAGDSEIKRELDHGGGQVRIMTVHAAKGLEAPIVFLPDTTGLPRADKMPRLLWSEDGIPLCAARKPGAGAAQHLWNDARRKQLEEYRRLLYVALTRAINRLYICGWDVKKDADAETSWYNLAFEALRPLNQPDLAAKDTGANFPAIVFADPEPALAKKSCAEEKTPVAAAKLPDWAFRPAPTEKAALKPLAPSQIAAPLATATPDSAFARGRIIHRLLQSLPDVADAQREKTAIRFLANPQYRLTPVQQEEICDEVMLLLRDPAYAPLFGAGSRAEVPIAGFIGAQPISGQIDRLCVQDDAVWVVDYKTNRPPPERIEDVPGAYRVQLASYRAVLQAIYPGKPVRCFLLWTYAPSLMELPESLLIL